MQTTNDYNRFGLRAPKGGCTVAGKFYRGGCFCPAYNEADPNGLDAKPAPLAGSSRQVSWANRLRLQAIARLDAQLQSTRKGRTKLLVARLGLMTTTSAVAFINAR